jgi:hypothetical protein
MLVGPDVCIECNVYIRLYPPNGSTQLLRCPVCESTDDSTYTPWPGKQPLSDSMIPLLRFMKGKNPQDW